MWANKKIHILKSLNTAALCSLYRVLSSLPHWLSPPSLPTLLPSFLSSSLPCLLLLPPSLVFVLFFFLMIVILHLYFFLYFFPSYTPFFHGNRILISWDEVFQTLLKDGGPKYYISGLKDSGQDIHKVNIDSAQNKSWRIF